MSIHAYPSYFVKDGITHQSAKGGLAAAVIASDPNGDEIIFHGNHPAVSVGSGDPNHKYTAIRNTPFNVKIRGADRHTSVLHQITIGDRKLSGNGHAVKRCIFQNFTLDGRGKQRPFISNEKSYGGVIGAKQCTLRSDNKTQFGFRSNGSYRTVFEDIDGNDGGQEWLIYCDYGPGRNIYRNISGKGWGRGIIQYVLRTYSNGNTVIDPNSELNIYNPVAINCGWAGAAAVTVNGFIGKVRIQDIYVDTPQKSGAVVCTFDNKQNEMSNPQAPANERIVIGPGFVDKVSLRACNQLVIVRGVVNIPNADRSMFNIDSCDELYFKSDETTVIESPKMAMFLEGRGFNKNQFRDKSIGKFEVLGDFSGWKRTGGGTLFEKRGNPINIEDFRSSRPE